MNQLDEKVIKGYQLLEPIGHGGFGAVYRAHQDVVEREVAVKVILPEFANRPEFIRRFDAEAQLVGRLEHPYIVPLYDYWRDPDGAYLVMRLLRGGNLHESIIKNGAWDVLDAARFLDQITSALATAHQNGIVHQDLKPGNIMLDEKNNAYLADFGIARNFRMPQSEGDDFPRMGTPLFMAPEQFSKSLQLTPQTDTYCLGLVLYTMLTGQMPFPDMDTKEVIRHQMQESLPPLQFVRPDLPREIDFVIMRATSKIPEVRYLAATMMAEDFREHIAGFTHSQHLTTANLQTAPSTGLPSNASGTVELGSGTIEIGTSTVELSQNPSTLQLTNADDTAILTGPALVVQNPYKGLRAFQEADAADFFGRADLTSQLMQRLGQSNERFLAVVGPSGSGKSSVVKAGLLPLLRQGFLPKALRWFIAKMHPGHDPLAALEAALLQVALDRPPALLELLRDTNGLIDALPLTLPGKSTELLLVIDQFEEVFTLIEQEEDRVHFLNLLYHAVNAPDSRLRVIITLRADFYDRPLSYANFGNLIKDHTAIILPLTDQELTDAITQPGRRANLTIEPALITALLADVREQPGTLPLLQYTLTELFERREDDTLTAAAYHNSGGLMGILSTQADERYQQLTPDQQQDARQIFLRLVAINEQSETTRQRVKLANLYAIGGGQQRAKIQSILDIFGQSRLLTFDYDPQNREPTVEIAHEALIREWERLQAWLVESRSDLLTQRRLSAAIQEWHTHHHDPSYLATGNRLGIFEEWQAKTSITLTEDEQRYISASIKLRQQAVTRRWIITAALVILAVGATLFAIFAVNQQQQAQQQARIAHSRELAATALNKLEQLDLSLLLSLEALSVRDTYEAQNSLLTGLQSEPYLLAFLPGTQTPVRSVAYAPDGTTIAAAGTTDTITLWDPATGQRTGILETDHTHWINKLAFSPDSQTLAAAGEDGHISLWNLTTKTVIPTAIPDSEQPWRDITFNPAGDQLVAVGDEGSLLRWDTVAATRLEGPHLPTTADTAAHIYTLAFSPDGRLLAFAGADSLIYLWDVAAETFLGEPLSGHINPIRDIAFTPNSLGLVSGDMDGRIVLWNTQTGQYLGDLTNAHSREVWSVAFSPDGQLLATGSTDNTIRVWDMATGTAALPTFTAHNEVVRDLAFSPDGTKLVSGGLDHKVILWSTDRQQLFAAQPLTLPAASAITYVPGKNRIATANGVILNTSSDNTIQLWDLDPQADTPLAISNEQTLTGHEDVVAALAFSPDGAQLISGSMNQDVLLWELAEQPTNQRLEGHDSGVLSADFHPSDALAATGDDTGTILLWDTATGQVMGSPLRHNTASVMMLAFNPAGDLLASGSRDGSIILWDTATHIQRHTLTGHTDGILHLAFSADGKTLASAGRDNHVWLWDVSTGEALGQPLIEHVNWVTATAFSPDGRLLATGDRGGRVLLWDMASRRVLGNPFEMGNHWITGLMFTEAGGTLLVATDETTITAWDVALASWQAQACAIVRRNLTADEQALYLNSPAANSCIE